MKWSGKCSLNPPPPSSPAPLPSHQLHLSCVLSAFLPPPHPFSFTPQGLSVPRGGSPTLNGPSPVTTVTKPCHSTEHKWAGGAGVSPAGSDGTGLPGLPEGALGPRPWPPQCPCPGGSWHAVVVFSVGRVPPWDQLFLLQSLDLGTGSAVCHVLSPCHAGDESGSEGASQACCRRKTKSKGAQPSCGPQGLMATGLI